MFHASASATDRLVGDVREQTIGRFLVGALLLIISLLMRPLLSRFCRPFPSPDCSAAPRSLSRQLCRPISSTCNKSSSGRVGQCNRVNATRLLMERRTLMHLAHPIRPTARALRAIVSADNGLHVCPKKKRHPRRNRLSQSIVPAAQKSWVSQISTQVLPLEMCRWRTSASRPIIPSLYRETERQLVQIGRHAA